MNLETMKSWARRLLLAFVLVSIGFALGKEVTLRRVRNAQAATPAPAGAAVTVPAPAGSRLQAYYLHGTIRCVTCNAIERTAKQLLDTEFAAEMAAGRMAWRTVNFEQEPALAKRYNVAASTLVLVRETDGKETGFRRLDAVWEVADKPVELQAYIRRNVKELLP